MCMKNLVSWHPTGASHNGWLHDGFAVDQVPMICLRSLFVYLTDHKLVALGLRIPFGFVPRNWKQSGSLVQLIHVCDN